jgi:DNA-binding transcriptional LysR family regulator
MDRVHATKVFTRGGRDEKSFPGGRHASADTTLVPSSARPPVRHSLDALVSAAIGGAGIARVPSWQVSADMSAGRLKAPLTDCERPAAPVHAVFQHSKLASAKIRTFIDYLVAQWAGEAFAGTWRLKG